MEHNSLPAIYYDGTTAKQHTVTIEFDSDGLRVRHTDSSIQAAHWPYNTLRQMNEKRRQRPVLIGQLNKTARLLIAPSDQRAFVQAIKHYAPPPKQAWMGWRGVVLAFALLASLIAGLYGILRYSVDPIVRLIPQSYEEQLGKIVLNEVAPLLAGGEGPPRICTHADGIAALEKLVLRLDLVDNANYRYNVTVIESDIINAFAAPGGEIIIFSGLIKEVPNGEALAGVLAHEISHVVKRHGMQNIVRTLGLSAIIATALGDISGSTLGIAAEYALSTSYSRELETEADRLGVSMLTRAGINNQGLATFFGTMKGKRDAIEQTFAFVLTHPPSKERAEALRRMTSSQGQAAFSDQEWQALQNVCDQTKAWEPVT